MRPAIAPELMATSRRNNPSYQQISAYLPRELVKRLKIKMAEREVEQSVAIEEAVKDWVEKAEANS